MIVELILLISAGDAHLEEKLSEEVIKDLALLGEYRDKFFINNVLLPLIKNEATLPVCIFESQKGDSSDESDWNPNFDSISTGGTTKKSDSTSSFLPSSLISSDARPQLIKAFNELVGGVSKSLATQLMLSLIHISEPTRPY